jgi:hypothetical protein
MIGPGDLLLVVSHLFAVPILVLRVQLKTIHNYLVLRNNFAGSHILSTTGDALIHPRVEMTINSSWTGHNMCSQVPLGVDMIRLD